MDDLGTLTCAFLPHGRRLIRLSHGPTPARDWEVSGNPGGGPCSVPAMFASRHANRDHSHFTCVSYHYLTSLQINDKAHMIRRFLGMIKKDN